MYKTLQSRNKTCQQIITVCTVQKLASVFLINCISGAMVSMLTSSAIDRELEPWFDQTKDYKIGICCFSPKHAVLRSKSKDWLARNLDIVFKWGDMSIRRLLFEGASRYKIQLSMLV
jgi:hypothetical protein